MQSQCVYWLKRADAPSPTNNYAFHVSMAIKLKKTPKKQRNQREYKNKRAKSMTVRAE